MRAADIRVSRLDVHSQRDEFARVVDVVLAHVEPRVETVGLYLLVIACWGLVVYTALAFALQ